MKLKRILSLLLLFLLIFSYSVFASEKPAPNAIFMGEVQEVQKNEKENVLSIKVKGYIKGCKVYKEEVVAILNEETLIIPNECPKEGEEIEIKKVNPNDFRVDKGDVVLLILSEAMTNSMPPQASVKAIQISYK